MTRALPILLLCSVLFLNVRHTEAAFKLRLDDGVNPATEVTDGDADGIIDFNGAIGLWTVNITTGLSKPEIGSADQPQLSLTSVNVLTSNVAGMLTIELTDTDYTGPVPGFLSLFGGTTDNTVEGKSYADDSNAEYGTADLLSVFGPLGSGDFSDADVALTGETGNPPYSLTLWAKIAHLGTGEEISSFNLRLKPIPEPASVVVWCLLATAGVFTVFCRRRVVAASSGRDACPHRS